MTVMTPLFAATSGTIDGLTDNERSVLAELWRVWTRKLNRAQLRQQYYEQHNIVKDLGIAIPPHLAGLDLALGWPAKAVDSLARLCKLEGFVNPDGDRDDPFGANVLWRENDMHMELGQVLRSALIHGHSFVTVTKGNPLFGEPEVLISSQSALHGAGLWDSRLRRLRAAISINDFDEVGRVVGWAMFLPNVTVSARYTEESGWRIDRHVHTLDRLPVELLAYKPNLSRPFGMSRITRSVMGLTDSALRTLVRMEVHAEFFSSPQRYAMGADEDMFLDENGNRLQQWEAIIGRVWAAPRDEDGQVPQLGQFPATSPQPHSDMLRTLASAFCAQTNLPLHELGIAPDANPTSALGCLDPERGLVNDANDAQDNFGPRIARAMVTALQIRDNIDTPTSEMLNLAVRWADPTNLPKSAAGDFIIKLVQALPWLAESRVPLEQLGWDEMTIERAWADKRRAGAANVLARLTQQQPAEPAEPAEPGDGLPG